MVRRLLGWFMLAAVVVLIPVAAVAQAGEPFSAWNVQLLYGVNYSEPGIDHEISKAIVTFENASGWTWGSSYFFIEGLRSYSVDDKSATEVYAEWYPSMSLRGVSGRAPGSGLVRDISVTLGINGGTKSNGSTPLAYLPGITIDFSIPGLKYASLGVYAFVDRSRFDGREFGAHGTSFQITPSWSLPFRIGTVEMSFDGFVDYIGEHGELSYQLLAQPQLKLDMSALWGNPGRVFVGVEWQRWKNKYGVQGLEENCPQALVFLNL